jgi:hypothetical protein
MKRSYLCLLLLLVLPIAAAAQASLADDGATGSTRGHGQLDADGALQKVRDTLGQIFQFKIESGQLKIDRATWPSAVDENEKKISANLNAAVAAATGNPAALTKLRNKQAEQAVRNQQRRDRFLARMGVVPPLYDLFHQVEMATDSLSSGGSDSQRIAANGAFQWTCTFHCETMTGELRLDNSNEVLEFRELAPPRRMLSYQSGNDVGLQLKIETEGGDSILLRQDNNGKCFFAIVSGNKAREEHADSFVELAKHNRQSIETEVLPVLAKFGICPIAPVDSPAVRSAVLASILEVKATSAEAERLFTQLDSDLFSVREKATETLTDNYPMFKELIAEKLTDRQIPLEVQSRLQRIVAGQPASALPVQTALAFGLASDPVYVVSLLDNTSDNVRAQLTKHLEKLTGQKLGDDVAAWQQWARAKEKDIETARK